MPRKAPAAGSKAGVALGLIADWCGRRARETSGIPEAEIFIPPPPDYFLETHWQWELARCFTKARNSAVFEPRTLEGFNKIVPPDKWKFSSSHASALLLFLRQNVDFVNAEYGRLHPSKPPRNSNNSTDNTREGMILMASRGNQLALAASLRRQHEQQRVVQKSTGDIDHQTGGVATPAGDVLAASSNSQRTSVAVPVQHTVVSTTPTRNSGSIFGSPEMLSSESALSLRAPGQSPTGEAVSQAPTSNANPDFDIATDPKSSVRTPIVGDSSFTSIVPESVFSMASRLDSPDTVTDVGSMSDHTVENNPSWTAARSNHRKENFADKSFERNKGETGDNVAPTTPISRGRKRSRPPLTPRDVNSGFLSIRGDESVPRSDGRCRRKVTLTEGAIQSGLYKL